MPVVTRVRGRPRIALVKRHRELQLLQAIDKLITGRASAEYVHARGVKVKELQRSRF